MGMNKSIKKAVVYMMFFSMGVSLFSGCGNNKDKKSEKTSSSQESSSVEESSEDDVSSETSSEEIGNFDDSEFGFSSRFDKNKMTGYEAAELKKAGSFNANVDFPMYLDDGLYVQTGSYRTIYNYKGEAIEGEYTNIERLNTSLVNDEFYVVSAVTDDLPKKGLIKIDGTVLIPGEAADIKEINDYFILLTYIDKETTDKSEANIFMGSIGSALTGPKEGDRLFVGHYVLYNLYTGKKYDDIRITDSYGVEACGDSIMLTLENGTKQIINCEDRVLAEKANLYQNQRNCFSIKKQSGEQEIYDSNMNLLFTLDKGKFIASSSDSGKYFIVDEYKNGKTLYEIYDTSGKRVLSLSEKDGNPEIENDNFCSLRNGNSKYAILNLNTKEKTDYIYDYVDAEKTFVSAYAKKDDSTYQTFLALGDTVAIDNINLKESPDMVKFQFISTDNNQLFIFTDKGFSGPNVEDSYSEIRYLKNGLITMQDAAEKYGIMDLVSGKQLLDYEYDEIESVYGNIYAKKGDVWEVYKIKSSFR